MYILLKRVVVVVMMVVGGWERGKHDAYTTFIKGSSL